MNIYITTQGARIIREGSHLLVKKGEDTYHTLFVAKLSQVVIYGSVEITSAAWRLLLKNGVDTVFLSKDGRYLGRFASQEAKNVMLRKRQFALLDDQAAGLDICRRIVLGKISSQSTLLMRISRTREIKELKIKAREIRSLADRLNEATTIDAILGYEGRASAIYFQAFKRGFLQDFGFHRRVRRPPTDPVNAVLSLLYTFLFNRVYSAIRQVNLDPYPGFLHAPDYGRFALVMDLMEEFRTIVVDTLTLSLFNLKILQKEDFLIDQPAPIAPPLEGSPNPPDITRDLYGVMSPAEGGQCFDVPPQRMDDIIENSAQEDSRGLPPVKLVPGAFARVIENFERKLTTEIHHPIEDRKMTYNEAIVVQAGLFRKHIEGVRAVYEPLGLK